MLGLRLDSVILKAFSNLNDSLIPYDNTSKIEQRAYHMASGCEGN